MLRPQDFAGNGVDIVFIFQAAGYELQFKHRGAVVMVKIPVVKHRVGRRHTGLGQGDFLGLLQGDVGRRLPVPCVGGVIVVVIDGYDTRSQLQALDRFLGAGAHPGQEPFAGEHRTGLQLQDNVSHVAVHIICKVAGRIDFHNQIF